MKNLICLLLGFGLCAFSVEKSMFGGHKLTLSEAERILGEPCQLTDESTTPEHGGHTYKSTFTANNPQPSGRVGVLYYIFESYGTQADAHRTFQTFVTGNQASSGFEKLDTIGDEGFFHSDGQNFYLLIARKNNEMIRLKVNKLTPKTSRAAMEKIAVDLLGRV